jgi:anti-anti-sigma factor
MIGTHVPPVSKIVCKPGGNLDCYGATSLRQTVRDSLQPGVEIVIDLSHVEFIDAAGMRDIVGAVRLARAFGATARVGNARPNVRRRMELVGVYGLVSGSLAARRGVTPLNQANEGRRLKRRTSPGS